MIAKKSRKMKIRCHNIVCMALHGVLSIVLGLDGAFTGVFGRWCGYGVEILKLHRHDDNIGTGTGDLRV